MNIAAATLLLAKLGLAGVWLLGIVWMNEVSEHQLDVMNVANDSPFGLENRKEWRLGVAVFTAGFALLMLLVTWLARKLRAIEASMLALFFLTLVDP